MCRIAILVPFVSVMILMALQYRKAGVHVCIHHCRCTTGCSYVTKNAGLSVLQGTRWQLLLITVIKNHFYPNSCSIASISDVTRTHTHTHTHTHTQTDTHLLELAGCSFDCTLAKTLVSRNSCTVHHGYKFFLVSTYAQNVARHV